MNTLNQPANHVFLNVEPMLWKRIKPKAGMENDFDQVHAIF
jgi:hypothetical protein